ncbi:Short-chain dehydrogenase/reductase SDR [Corchorus olitorius]|uniref:Short-chain dehydrogenase/reductase SDR n=1 Tax=Corchorus olitorius TaxID=93759 RepID=A0A1R3GAG7_9ROSI|nr:Short-chain dehydrogenase/reductase SDR [Corchorus olitorius]
MAVDLIHKFLNMAAPPFTFFSFLFFLPPYYLFKSFLSILSSIFSENVSGKVVIITGASSGIGEHLAYEYGRRGARLALTARREKSLLEVADRARDLGSPDVITIRADVSNIDDCRRLVDDTVNHFGRLDHLVNNAGMTSVCMFEDAPPDMNNFRAVMASSAAMSAFFESLRVEFGSDIGITIATPGYIESEITMGKYLKKEGELEVQQDLRDAQVGFMPVGSVSGCARAIENSACRGDRYVTEPSWFSVTFLWKLFFPEVFEWSGRLFSLPTPGRPPHEALNKRIMDFTGAKNVLYPSTIQSPDVKTE